MTLFSLVAELAEAAASPEPLSATTKVLNDRAGDPAAILSLLSFMSGSGSDTDQSFYRSPEVSLLKVKFDPGEPSPPHDHGTWAAILLLEGEERNTLYRRANGSIEAYRDVVLKPGDVLPMPPDAIHVVDCATDKPAIGLHVYGGDLPIIDRSVWNPQTLEEHPLTDETYSRFKALAA